MKKKLVGCYISFDDTFTRLYRVIDENRHYVLYVNGNCDRIWERKEYISHVFFGFLSVYKFDL